MLERCLAIMFGWLKTMAAKRAGESDGPISPESREARVLALALKRVV